MRRLFGKKSKKGRSKDIENLRARFTDEEWEDLKFFVMLQFLGATGNKMDKLPEVQQGFRNSPKPHPLVAGLFADIDETQCAQVLMSIDPDKPFEGSYADKNHQRVRALLERKLSSAENSSFWAMLHFELEAL